MQTDGLTDHFVLLRRMSTNIWRYHHMIWIVVALNTGKNYVGKVAG